MDCPSEFICPITMQIMEQPLTTRYGHNFECAAIVAWLRQGSTECPLTRKRLGISDMIRNNNLKEKIRAWRAANGIQQNCDNGSEDSENDEDELLRVLGMASITVEVDSALLICGASSNSISLELLPPQQARSHFGRSHSTVAAASSSRHRPRGYLKRMLTWSPALTQIEI